MSWYHTDWSWVQTLTTAAGLVVLGGILVWAIARWLEDRRHPHHRRAVGTTTAIAGRRASATDRSTRHAEPHPNGTRAA